MTNPQVVYSLNRFSIVDLLDALTCSFLFECPKGMDHFYFWREGAARTFYYDENNQSHLSK